MKISIITLFPEMFTGPFDSSIIKRARDKKLVDIKFVDLREHGVGKHKMVDDTPYGGGPGMVLKVDVLHEAIEKTIDKKLSKNEQKVILFGAHGKNFNQEKAKEYSTLSHLILICGHYEGVDERIKDYIDEEISVGDFVLTGGEIPAMLVTDSVLRLVSGVIRKGATQTESFSPLLEYPQYTNPQVYKGKKVPDILLSGDHKKIDDWRGEESKKVTKSLRPDLLRNR